MAELIVEGPRSNAT
uniref:Uncharacterized protein n=1 Tax=Oryza barthii TaxID=65489 RepID=A0A0D3GZX4_9ORYZ